MRSKSKMKKPDLFNESIDIFLSIHPQYAEKILDGLKTIELRRRFPTLNGFAGRLLIYSTTPIKSVIGFAEIEDVHYLPIKELWSEYSKVAYIEKSDFLEYFKGLTAGYAIELKNPQRFVEPLSIDYLKQNYGMIAPQSYRYLNEEHEALFSHERSNNKDTSGY
jgi:predicted transcriptional regulator